MEVEFDSQQENAETVKLEDIDNPHDFSIAVAYAQMNPDDVERITVTARMFKYLIKDVGHTEWLMYKGVAVHPNVAIEPPKLDEFTGKKRK